jgi:hypothetical protein
LIDFAESETSLRNPCRHVGIGQQRPEFGAFAFQKREVDQPAKLFITINIEVSVPCFRIPVFCARLSTSTPRLLALPSFQWDLAIRCTQIDRYWLDIAEAERPPVSRILKLVMHENREENNDRQRNSDKPEQRTSSKTHVSLLYDGVLRPYGKKVPTWELRKPKKDSSPPSDVPLRGFKLEAAKSGGVDRFKGAADTAKSNPRYWDVQVVFCI